MVMSVEREMLWQCALHHRVTDSVAPRLYWRFKWYVMVSKAFIKIRRRANVRTREQLRGPKFDFSMMADSEARGGGLKKVDVLVRSRNVVRTTH